MTDRIETPRLIDFVRHLYEIHSDYDGFNMLDNNDRCHRWMDAVLPAPPKDRGVTPTPIRGERNHD